MDSKRIINYMNIMIEIGTASVSYKEGVIAFKAALWAVEEIERRGKGSVKPEELGAYIDGLIREMEGPKASESPTVVATSDSKCKGDMP